MKPEYILLFILFIFNTGCKESRARKQLLNVNIENESDQRNNVRQIFYSMYLPSEMSRMFERAGANYNPDIPNSYDKFQQYSQHDTIAVILGVYGVDLGYSRIFDQTLASAKYFEIIQILSEKMGIPADYYQDILLAFEEHNSNKDSLARFVAAIYGRADKYLKENEKEAYSALIIMGGWIEAVYIAYKIAEEDPDNIEMIQRIAEQKYSLNGIISLLSNYRENVSIAKNLVMLRQLKKSYDKIEIYSDQNDFKMDTVNKVISIKDNNAEVTPELISEIGTAISIIRASIVD